MKTLPLFFVALLALIGCQKSRQTNTAETPTNPVVSDSAAIADAVHGFYSWYVAFSKDTTHRIDFTDDRGEHLQLVQPKLERYYAHFKASGFVSNEFIQGEYAFYKQCSQVWQNELIDEVPSCLDADKYFCAQDWEPAFWTTSPVRIKHTGADRAVATLYGKYFDAPMERNVSLKKENGKWLITSIACDMGLSTATTGIQLKSLTIDEDYMTAQLARRSPISQADFARFEIGNIVSDDKRKAPGAKVCLLDTLLTNDRGKVVLLACDTGNETEAWLVQYGNSPKILFWDQVYYADQVEYMKTINTTVAGNGLTIRTTTDPDGTPQTKTRRYVLTNQLIFERD